MSSARRNAALTATLVALPVAVVAGVAVYVLRSPASPAPSPSAAPTSAAGPVTVTAPPSGSAAVSRVCAKLLGALPTTLDGRHSRAVSDAPDRVVAWGDPPVVLRCGVRPVSVPPDTNKQFEINGVTWYAQARGGAVVFTTTDRTVPVEVTVPATLPGNPADVPATLARPIARTIPARS